ncbi:hypothetical protein B0H17DRAFT_850639, partial [Mycena rosella]
FMQGVHAGYKGDAFFTKILENPSHYPTFSIDEGVIYTNYVMGVRCLCIPRIPGLKGPRRLTELVIDYAHKMIGHLGSMRTAEYIRRWYWW